MTPLTADGIAPDTSRAEPWTLVCDKDVVSQHLESSLEDRRPGSIAPAAGAPLFFGDDRLPPRSALLQDLTILSCLASAAACSSNALRQVPLSLADAVVVSLYSTINAAYVFRQYDCCHELLTSAAWLGHLMRGRAAMMPLPVAECLADCLSRVGAPSDDQSMRANTELGLIAWHGERHVGLSNLLKHAHRVIRHRQAVLVKPQRRLAFNGALPDWNCDRRRIIGDRLDTLGII